MSGSNATDGFDEPIVFTQDELWADFGFGILLAIIVVLVCYSFAAAWDVTDM